MNILAKVFNEKMRCNTFHILVPIQLLIHCLTIIWNYKQMLRPTKKYNNKCNKCEWFSTSN